MSFGSPLSGQCTRMRLPYGPKHPSYLYLYSLTCESHKLASPSTSSHPSSVSRRSRPCLDYSLDPYPAGAGGRPAAHLLPRHRGRAHVPLQRAGTATFLTNLARSSWRAAPASGGAGRTRGLNAQGGRGARWCSVGPRKAARGEPAASAPRRWPGRRGGAPFVAAQ